MPELLGSLLLRKGLVTKAQLDAALAAQAKHRGRLGTNLVELKHLTLAALGAALAEQRGGTLATKDELDAATANVLVSKRVAKLHLAVPIRVENRVLLVAMASAWDSEAVDALERELRSRVTAKLAPELVVLRYLDRIYDVKSGRPVSVYDHPFAGTATAAAAPNAPLSSAPGFLTDDGDEAFLGVSPAPLRPLGVPPAAPRPAAAGPAAALPPGPGLAPPGKGPAAPRIESKMDELLRAAVPMLRPARTAPPAMPGPLSGAGLLAGAEEAGLEEVEPLPDDLPVLAGTVLEGSPEAPADDSPPAAPLPDIPDEWK